MSLAGTAGPVAIEALTPRRIIKLIAGTLGATAAIGLTVEAVQAAGDYRRLVADPIFQGAGVPHGDGRRVLLIPGFLGSDSYLKTLHQWLGRIGYAPMMSGLKRNTGFNERLLAAVEARAIDAARESGRPIAIIGHSLGGIYARAIARRHPAAVERIMTLGSPLKVDEGPISPAIGFTALFSRKDRIVRYPRALATESGVPDVEVSGCHCGMAFNVEVFRAIGEFLAARAN